MGDWAPAEAMAQLSRPGKVLLTGGSWFRETLQMHYAVRLNGTFTGNFGAA